MPNPMAHRAMREQLRRIAQACTYLFAPLLAALFVVQLLLGNETHWQILFLPAGFGWFGWLSARWFAPKTPSIKPAAAPRLALKAPNPRPGQCPVCSLEDLDERAIGDDLLGDTGTPLARVVPYGPHRAHAECAEVVPFVAVVQAEPRTSATRVDWAAARQLPASGSQSWSAWQERGFLRHEAEDWYSAGFTPWHAQEYRDQGFYHPGDLPERVRERFRDFGGGLDEA